MALQIALNTLGLQTLYMGVNSRNPSKSGLFALKVGVYSRKPPKTGLFKLPGALFKSGVAVKRIEPIEGELMLG